MMPWSRCRAMLRDSQGRLGILKRCTGRLGVLMWLRRLPFCRQCWDHLDRGNRVG